MVPSIPDDVLHMICEELGWRREFGTLFACATVNKNFAVAALSFLYRAQHLASVKEDTSNEAISFEEQELVAKKWSILWRSIILSCMNKTAFPYCKYIRVLDLRDLQSLLEDARFRGAIAKKFFAGELARFHSTSVTNRRNRPRGFNQPRLDVRAIVDGVGELVTQHTSVVEAIDTGWIHPSSLIKWLPRMPLLRSIVVWDGAAFGDASTATEIRKHCRRFDSCGIYMWIDPHADDKLSTFLSGLPGQSLRSFITYSRTGFGRKSCLGLSGHSRCLKELRLVLERDVIPHLGLLKDCIAVETLELTDNARNADLQSQHHDVFLDVVAWLRACTSLHTLILHNFSSGAAMATPVLLEEKITLQHLEVDNYASNDQQDFHVALPHQKQLQRLVLESEQIETRNELDSLAHSVCELKSLRVLKLIGISTFFREQHIEAIATQLKDLEELYVGGLGLMDDSLIMMTALPNLRVLSFYGITRFTLEGFLEFIKALGPGNHGMLLAVDNADVDADDRLSYDEQAFVRRELADRVDGRFEYTYLRDPDVSEFEDSSNVERSWFQREKLKKKGRRLELD